MGAIGEGGVRVLNHDVIAAVRVSKRELVAVERDERTELERRAHLLREGRTPVSLHGRTAVIVDDGMATGASARRCLPMRAHRGCCRRDRRCPSSVPRSHESDRVLR